MVASVPPQGGRKHPHQEFIQIDTTNILFICGGAFDGIDKIIQNRIGKKQWDLVRISEAKGYKYRRCLAHIAPQDLLKYGLIPEFIGRLPVVVTLDSLDKADLIRVLKEPRNALVKQYQKLLEMDDVLLEFDDEALEAIADKALSRNIGARGLRAIIEDVMLNIMYDIPSRRDVEKCIIHSKCITDNEQPELIINENRKPLKRASIKKAKIKNESAS